MTTLYAENIYRRKDVVLLTEEDIIKIYLDKRTPEEIADDCSLDENTIIKIKNKHKWKYLLDIVNNS